MILQNVQVINARIQDEEVRKRPDRAEADRFYNYPYVALEEALANAVYHKVMEANGSPPAIFETDEESHYSTQLIVLKYH
jgi:predicted HTH transcriptional regulator